jgi:hypothetical protein
VRLVEYGGKLCGFPGDWLAGAVVLSPLSGQSVRACVTPPAGHGRGVDTRLLAEKAVENIDGSQGGLAIAIGVGGVGHLAVSRFVGN